MLCVCHDFVSLMYIFVQCVRDKSMDKSEVCSSPNQKSDEGTCACTLSHTHMRVYVGFCVFFFCLHACTYALYNV